MRDWIVRGDRQHPKLPPAEWVIDGATEHLTYDIQEGVLPKDLDIELSASKYFDVMRFIGAVRECGIDVDHHEHIPQRHVFLFESKRGPFTADFIEPHFAALHTTADFDVNTLSVVSYADLMGLKMVYTDDKQTPLVLDDVIASCLKKEFVQMKGGVGKRREKMEARGWQFAKEVHYYPCNDKTNYTVVSVSSSDPVFKSYAAKLKKMTKQGPGHLVDMYEIRSSQVDQLYKAMKDSIERDNHGSANERSDLFHGLDPLL